MKLIVGLGNPGARYEATRHNVGFMVVDRLAKQRLLDGPRNRFHAETYEGIVDHEKVMLLKPQTYMNRSGLAVGEAARFFKVEPQDVLILVDDVALPSGSIRLRGSGGAGGHNGLADVQRALGTQKYPRLRIGVDEPLVNGRRVNQADYVLGPFTDEQWRAVDKALDEAAKAVATWVTDGIDLAMTRHNTPTARPTARPTKQQNKNVNQSTESRSESPDADDSQTTERTEQP